MVRVWFSNSSNQAAGIPQVEVWLAESQEFESWEIESWELVQAQWAAANPVASNLRQPFSPEAHLAL